MTPDEPTPEHDETLAETASGGGEPPDEPTTPEDAWDGDERRTGTPDRRITWGIPYEGDNKRVGPTERRGG